MNWPVAEESVQHATILVVDDEAANVRILERTLLDAGYTNVQTATDPTTVVQPATPPWDLILLDLHMPGLDGFAVMEQLAPKIPKDTYLPVVILTADISADVRRRALATGATDFLTKPLDLLEVLLRIRNLLENRLLHVALQAQNRELDRKVRERTEELRRSLSELRRIDDERRRLMARLVNAEEEERRRIASDVHDDPVQVMTAAHLHMQLLRKTLTDPDVLATVKRVERSVKLSVERLRSLMFELRPIALDRHGLAAALRLHVEHHGEEDGPTYVVDNRFESEPAPEVRALLYRVALEALANVRKHARASLVRIVLETRDGEHVVRIEDDGRGFDPGAVEERPGHLGLASMRERMDIVGGRWRIDSRPGHGTTVEFVVPSHAPRQVDGSSAQAVSDGDVSGSAGSVRDVRSPAGRE